MKSTILIIIATLFFSGYTTARIEFDLYQEKTKLPSRFKRHLMTVSNPSANPWTNDSVVLFKYLNGEYYGLIGIGSPAKTFKVIFDTTWSDTWIPSSHCAWTEIVCKLHTQYDSSKSSSYIPNGRIINITNSQLSLAGLLSTDTFYLPHVKVVNQTFMEATHISLNPFIQYKADGIIGLAYKSQSLWADKQPFFYNMIQQQVIKEGVFTFYMNRDETTEKAGKIIFGGRQREHVKENTLTEVKVIEKKLWKITMDSVFAKKNKTSYAICKNCPAIFDSSSNNIIGPWDVIQDLNYMLNAIYFPGLNRYTVNCREYAKLPEIHFVLNGNDFSIQSKYYVQRLTLGNVEACFSPFIPRTDSSADYWELGGAFMMEFYTEFDMDNNVINIGETIF